MAAIVTMRTGEGDDRVTLELDDSRWHIASFARTRKNRTFTLPTIGGAYVRPLGRQPTTLSLNLVLSIGGTSKKPAPPLASPKNWYASLVKQIDDSFVGQLVDLEMYLDFGLYVLESVDYNHDNMIVNVSGYAVPRTITVSMKFVEATGIRGSSERFVSVARTQGPAG